MIIQNVVPEVTLDKLRTVCAEGAHRLLVMNDREWREWVRLTALLKHYEQKEANVTGAARPAACNDTGDNTEERPCQE